MFGVIMADPPWAYHGNTGRTKKLRFAPDHHYPTMTLADICALPVSDIANDNCVLLLWATWPKLPEALKVMSSWGFAYTTGLPWLKMSRAGAIQIGIGYHVRSCSEMLLIGKRGSVTPEPSDRQAGVLFCGRGAHSAKPDDQYKIAESYPGPYCELFARPDGGLSGRRKIWKQLGNDATGRDIRDDIAALKQRQEAPGI